MRKVIIALAIVLIVFVLVGSVVLHLTGSMRHNPARTLGRIRGWGSPRDAEGHRPHWGWSG